jgi:hypothetical protein
MEVPSLALPVTGLGVIIACGASLLYHILVDDGGAFTDKTFADNNPDLNNPDAVDPDKTSQNKTDHTIERSKERNGDDDDENVADSDDDGTTDSDDSDDDEDDPNKINTIPELLPIPFDVLKMEFDLNDKSKPRKPAGYDQIDIPKLPATNLSHLLDVKEADGLTHTSDVKEADGLTHKPDFKPFTFFTKDDYFAKRTGVLNKVGQAAKKAVDVIY